MRCFNFGQTALRPLLSTRLLITPNPLALLTNERYARHGLAAVLRGNTLLEIHP